jgi:hypothetical protein
MRFYIINVPLFSRLQTNHRWGSGKKKSLWRESKMTNGSFIATLHAVHFLLTKIRERAANIMNWILKSCCDKRQKGRESDEKDEFEKCQQSFESETRTCFALWNKMENCVGFIKKCLLKCQWGLRAVAFVLHFGFELVKKGQSEGEEAWSAFIIA